MKATKSENREIRELTTNELEFVSGGSMLQNAFSNVIKSIGEGLSTMARKG